MVSRYKLLEIWLWLSRRREEHKTRMPGRLCGTVGWVNLFYFTNIFKVYEFPKEKKWKYTWNCFLMKK